MASLALGILGLVGGLLGSSFFGGKSASVQAESYAKQASIAETEAKERKKREATLKAISTPVVGRQRSKQSFSPLGKFLGVGL